jgi:phospholipid/cholesterol/gamma-HCH transport system permease protein
MSERNEQPPIIAEPPTGLADSGPSIATPAGLEAAGGRFISRGRLTLRAMYWVAWIAVTRQGTLAVGFLRELEALGLGAVRLVASAGVLVGLIAIFQVAYQLNPLGAEMLSPRAVGWFAARELAPVVAGLLVVARSSSAIAGELATMATNAELDSLRAMGLDPVKYLVAPKVGALLIALPALTALANGAIFIGLWIGSSFFLDLGTAYFLDQMHEAMHVRDVMIGLGKSVIFAFVLGIVSADEGLAVERTHLAIGTAATRAVVYCLIGVLAADTVVNAVFYFIPGLV